MRRFLAVAALAALSGCASIVEGKHQEIRVNSTPPGADCVLLRDGQQIGEVTNTPGSVIIEKTDKEIRVLCSKKGYKDASSLDKSDMAAAAAGDLAFGVFSIVGIAVDYSTGAGLKYDGQVNVNLVPAETAPEAAAKPPAPPALPPAPQKPAV